MVVELTYMKNYILFALDITLTVLVLPLFFLILSAFSVASDNELRKKK